MTTAANRRRPTAQLAVAGVVGAAVVGTLSGLGGTYGLWHDEARLDAGTVRAGTLGLSLTGLDRLATTYTAEAPAAVARVVVTNAATGTPTGRIDSFAVAPAVAGDPGLAPAIDVAIWPAGETCEATPPAGATDWAGWLAGTGLAADDSAAYCVRTAVDPAALPELDGRTVTWTVTVTGATGGWTTTASAEFAQSVDVPEPDLPPVTSPSCSQNGGQGLYFLDFDFSAAVPNDGTRYRVYLDDHLLTQDVYGTWAHVGLNSGDVANALTGLEPGTVTQHVLTVRLYDAPHTVAARFAVWVKALPDGAGVTLQCQP